MPTPEALAREDIDALLTAAGWVIQDRNKLNLAAGLGVAVREFPVSGGEADYMLFVDRKAVGVVEAKPAGVTLSGVADQSAQYQAGLPANIPHVQLPLPFAYESTGIETYFRSLKDPEPKSRRVFAFHRPETLAEWAAEAQPLRARLRAMPPLLNPDLWPAQRRAILGLEDSLKLDRPRALIQMATGSGKTFTAVNAVYRLLKFAKARRVLFLVDRTNLGRQALREFQGFTTPDDGRKMGELYNIQRLQTNALDGVNQVVITTIQRLYSMLCGEPDLPEENEEVSLFELGAALDRQEPKSVRYNPNIPIETFDFIITDECHRSIYHLWRQVLEYFDASLIGLTATPSKQTLGFFDQNLVIEYNRRMAVIDGVNVDGQVYRIRTEIGEHGSSIEAGFYVDKRDKKTRARKWEQLEDELTYAPEQLDREVVSKSQIRTVIRAFRDRVFTELFPGREEVPKTLIFAKDDSHAEDIVEIVREEFGRGNDFCQKITYRTTGKPEDLIGSFRNAYYPRVAVTVDMIATGTDVKPIEILLFMRLVRSRNYFEQMLGRGTRIIPATDMEQVNPGVRVKDRFILIDAVGVVEQEKLDTQTLERKRTVPFKNLVESLAFGVHDEDTLSSLAGRLARLEKRLSPAEQEQIARAAGENLKDLTHRILDALDVDRQYAAACETFATPEPDETQIEQAADALLARAAEPFLANPELRRILLEIQQHSEQTIDTVSVDRVLSADFDAEATQKARALLDSFAAYIREHQDEIDALQIIYNRPYAQRRLTYAQVKDLAGRLDAHQPNAWTTESLWRAYAQLEKDRVHGAGTRRVLTDLVSLVRHAVELDDELVPYPERVQARYADWLAAQQAAGKSFTPEQRWWLDRIAGQIGVNLSVGLDDFDVGEFFSRGGRLGAMRVFGSELQLLIQELNDVLTN
jgi:type I restriction enzyme R subunit